MRGGVGRAIRTGEASGRIRAVEQPDPTGSSLSRNGIEQALGAEKGVAPHADRAGGGKDIVGGARAGGEEVGEPITGFGEDG